MASILDKFKEAPAENKVRDMSKKVKVGIIGTGWIAEAHVKAYQKCPDVEIVALADLVPGKAEAFCETYNVGENVKFYPSHKELVDAGECDAVSVCTYNATHAECTIYALEKGVNVLLEKPMKMVYGKFKAITAIYGFVLAFMTFLSASLAIMNKFENMTLNFMFAGGVFFLISDLILSGTYFGEGKRRPVDVITNHTTYYAAQFLIAASLMFI